MKKIPDLRGLEVEDAKELLRKKSIKFADETKKTFSLTVGNGKIVKVEEENNEIVLYESNRKFFLFFILGTITVVSSLALSITYGTGIFNSVKDQIIEITGIITEPELEAEPGWGKERIVKVKKDAKGSKEIKFYEYCVRKDKNEECDWKETYTKNTVISKTGTWYVTFRGVDKDGKRGKEATITVYVDNEAPEIKEFKVEKEEETTVKVKTTASDKDSGLAKIMYSLDGINYTEGKNEYTYSNLEAGLEYTLYVKAIDKVGNEKVVTLKLVKKTQEEIELEKEESKETKTEESKETKTEEKEWDTPEIDLKKLPSVFEYGEKYDLPSKYDFGNDEGIVVCKVDGIEEKDTKNLTVGKHEVKCTATSNHKKEAQVEKEFEVTPTEGNDEALDGWIKLNLYYPEGTTNWEWRLDGEEGIRTGYKSDSWKPYTGPILIKLEDTGNVYIRYKVKGEPVIIAPNGKVVVDIEPNDWTLNDNEKTKVKITYDSEAKNKKYRINGGNWQEYKGEFEVEPNTLIEAKATKEEKVYDSEGELQYTKKVTGTDTAYISKYLEPTEVAPAGPGGVPVQPTTPSDPENPTEPRITTPTPGTPSPIELAGPIITSNPSSEIVEETTITITPQQEASKVYYKINNGAYKVYTTPFTVTDNCDIYAYYVSKEEGQTSLISGYRVNNIKSKNLPYVKISANPSSLTQSIKEATVTISGTDYEQLEYSLDGTLYQEYTSPLTIKQSTTVYARGTNQYGSKIETLTIVTEAPPRVDDREDLTVHIELNPESSNNLLAYTDVTITYDSKAENKYYSIDGGYSYSEYTGPFRVSKNTTVVGYATSTKGSGSARKTVDFLSNGVINPVINIDPNGSTTAYSVVVEIEYDKNASVKQYKIGSGEYQNYTGPFEVGENTTITAYNKNVLNEEASSYKTITNIVPEPRYTPIDLGDYYQIKLNYPDVSSDDSREYKWKETGSWKTYNQNGILLIKQEAKDKYDLTADGIEIIDTKGKTIRISMEDVYVLDCPTSELSENLFMRWDIVKPKTPTINLSTDEATKEVLVTINYDKQIVDKEYKIVYADGTETDWQEYTGSFKIDKNNTVIYAKGKDRSEVKSDVATKKITNIDEIAPVITIKGDLVTKKRSVPIQITATDDLLMYMVKWAEGKHDADYFNEEKDDNGTSIKNGSTVTFAENGTYTIYAVDSVGNETLKEIIIENIDLTAPDVTITVLTSGITTQARVSIDYGDSETKLYSIGDNTHYNDYEDELIISAYDYIGKGNTDGSLTIYAKGFDSVGNLKEVSEDLYCLDLEAIEEPTIIENVDYPMLTQNGFIESNTVSATFANRNDIVNEISVDNGKTWQTYTGPVEVEVPTTVKARSKKITSSLTVTIEKELDEKISALTGEAYDQDNESEQEISANSKATFKVENDGQTKKITIRSNQATGSKVYIYGTDGTLNKTVDIESTNQSVTLSSGTTKVEISAASDKLTVSEIVINGIIETVNGNSILSIIQNNNLENNHYYVFKVGNELYPVHMIVLEGNQIITQDTTYGDAYDVGTANSYAENMVIVKVNGDYTVNEEVTVAPYSTKYGGPKGFFLYVTGKLTNNGTIDNSHGAYAQGQDVKLWQNANGSYEYIPAEGAEGGAIQSAGGTGTGRQTGGGSGGGMYNSKNTTGGTAGTSYSGGTGSGGAYATGNTEIAQPNGGTGGNGGYVTGGGAGNPGGSGDKNGENGTGGLLIIYANEYENAGYLTANGSNGGSTNVGGGNSGAGSINIFTNQATRIDRLGIIADDWYNDMLGNYQVNGGTSTGSNPGVGGAGTINIGEIKNGTYYDLKEIIEDDIEKFKAGLEVTGDSIIDILNSNPDLASGFWLFKVNNGTKDIIYNVHLIVEDGRTINTAVTYGSEADCASGESEEQMAKNMVIVKFNGDLTITNTGSIGPVYNETYGGPKGFMIYVTGTLINEGIIDNSHGAYAYGDNVYLLKNAENDYEVVPAEGAEGSGLQTQPDPATGRQTGGGSGGGFYNSKNKSGGTAGTSYSGGTGGAGAYGTSNTILAQPNGGKGGGGGYSNIVGGGAGNPGGEANVNGQNGTGGLLIIYADIFTNTGSLTAKGSNGGSTTIGGGNSGGGSINVFYHTKTADGTTDVTGGSSTGSNPGRGGTGTVTYTQIDTSNTLSSMELSMARTVVSANTVGDTISKNITTPMITVEVNENKGLVSIEKDENYKTEYSLDLGTTWIEYTEPFEVIENTTIFTRVVDNEEKILSSSTYTITSIKEKEENKEEDKEESTEVLPSETTPEIVEKDNKEEGESDETNE